MATLKVPHRHEKHNDIRWDPYFWLRERDSAAVMRFLQEENERLDKALAPEEKLRDELFREMKGRIKEDDESVPRPQGEYFYQTQWKGGHEYPLYVRWHKSRPELKEVLFDVNELAKGHEYFSCSGPILSPNQRVLTMAIDTVGRRFYELRFKDLQTGKFLPEVISSVTGQVVWSHDSRAIYFTKQDSDTLRPHQVHRYVFGGGAPELVYEENDETFRVYIYGGKQDRFVFIRSNSTTSDETRVFDMLKPERGWHLVQRRERCHEHTVIEGEKEFFILTNWCAPNFRVMRAGFDTVSKSEWIEVVSHQEDVLIEDLDSYPHHLVLSERQKGLTQIRVHQLDSSKEWKVDFPDPAYVVSYGSPADFDSEVFRIGYESLATPPSVIQVSLKSAAQTILKVEEVPNFNSTDYRVERMWAQATDGAKIPISVLLRRNRKKEAGPLLLYGYGAYGLSSDPHFDSNVLSLVDRGFAYAIAHVRGGSEMGRRWYEEGRQLKKMNSFNDFIACAEHLINAGVTSSDQLYISGGSAGGLLIAAVLNLQGELFHGAVASVPFVDVLTTMLDDSIPLTTNEYDEWGNPNEKKYYDYIKTYSPFDNVKSQNYPHLLVVTGYHDSQVQYWEPAKWVARLRELKTDQNLLLFRTELKAGHSGLTGRFSRLKDTALEFAFLLKLARGST